MINLLDAVKEMGLTDVSDWAVVISKIASDPKYSNRTIVVPRGDYLCYSQMTLGSAPGARPISLVGEGPVDWSDAPGRGAVFRWKNTSAIGDETKPVVVINASSTHLKWLRFQGMSIKQNVMGTIALINCRCVLEDVTFLNWHTTDAVVRISSDTERTGYTQGANNWTLNRVYVRGVWGPGKGIIVDGGDANHGLAIQTDASDVQEGVSIEDSSFLGNIWLAPHVHAGESNRSAPYSSLGRSARSLFLGAYTEGPVPSTISPPSSWIGGMGIVKGGATVLAEGFLKNIVAIAPTIRTTAFNNQAVQRLIKFEFEEGIDPTTGKPVYDSIEGVVDYRKTADGKFVYYLGGYLRFLWKSINSAEIFKTPLRERRGK